LKGLFSTLIKTGTTLSIKSKVSKILTQAFCMLVSSASNASPSPTLVQTLVAQY